MISTAFGIEAPPAAGDVGRYWAQVRARGRTQDAARIVWFDVDGAATPEQHAAALKLLQFIWKRNAEWARTGHLPVRRSVAESAAFKALPFRENLTEITRTGTSMPGNVPTQRAIELLIGEDVSNLMVSNKPIAEVQADVEKQVNKALKKVRR